jgi:uncharacterized RDD family membrane protein YckC
LYCAKCGAEVPGGADRCTSCGQLVAESPQGQGLETSGAGVGVTLRQRVVFAGFWLRLVAFLIDFLIIFLVMSPLLLDLLIRNVGPEPTTQKTLAFLNSGARQALAINLLVEMARWLYFATFESSAWQATPGKRMLGLYVTDLSGRRITFARASGRAFGKILSEFTFFFGYVAAAFTQKKQALHDMISGCLVLRKV